MNGCLNSYRAQNARQLRRDRGAALVEASLLIALVSMIAIGSLEQAGEKINGAYCNASYVLVDEDRPRISVEDWESMDPAKQKNIDHPCLDIVSKATNG